MTTLITDQAELAAFCARQASADYIAIDTEFMRESTYWPILCLVQIAGPEEAAAIDPLAPGIDLAPLFALMADQNVLKVFHSARQDVEIFVKLTGAVPTPIFDTQIAAMVCGFGDSVGYETLVTKLAGARIDKSSRFTDWSRRPLTEKQLHYALADVIHLRPAYEKLRAQLAETGREKWLGEELKVLTDAGTYITQPEDAWQRIKTRSSDPRFLAILRELAAWRETEAQKRNQPRGRILRDDALMEIAAHAPKTTEELARTRGLSKSMAEGWQGTGLLAGIERALALPRDQRPKPEQKPALPQGLGPTVDLLRVLLKMKCEANDVAQKLVASASDLELIAADDEADVPALHGWRREMFGEDALALKHGRVALAIEAGQVKAVPVG
ncbi:ribonuclease D [Inquilinus sp. CAU 1745]|uniref:ribonuclease D n=1 Tax=Inquilinus sp. CAU 1745 TaxID=3140369 RepID=UPI00325A9BE5